MTYTNPIIPAKDVSVNAPGTFGTSAPDRFSFFIRSTAGDFPAYFRAMRGRTEKLEIGGAERFARRWIAEQVTATGALLEGCEDMLVDCAMERTGINGLALVVAALLAISLRRFEDAEVLAGRATAADQHETFAQRLLLAAREQSSTLRLEVDDWLEDRFCSNPFTTAEIIGSRDVYTCCAAWMPASLGRADSGEPVWEGARAAEIRRSILDGDFGHCSRLSCPRIVSRDLPRRNEVTDPALRRAIDASEVIPSPSRVLLSYDESCNLSCPSCRTTVIMADRAKAEELDTFFDEHVNSYIESAREIKVTGSGDAFGSRHFRKVLSKITANHSEAPRLQLQTNGVLFDQRAWDEVGLSGHVRSIWVSVDAAQPDTYAKLRRGGQFSRLVKNLEMLGRLRSENAFAEFRLDFVVQNENFAELEEFVSLAHQVGADGVHLLQLRNWGTFSPETFREMEVTRPDHPNHGALLEILSRPCFRDGFVDLGNLSSLRRAPFFDRDEEPTVDPSVPTIRRIVVFGAARTGTNYLFQGLRSFGELMVFSEVFNQAGAFGLEHYGGAGLRHLSQHDGINYAGERDRRLVARLDADPPGALDIFHDLARQRNASALAFKLFPGHISDSQQLERIFDDPGLAPIIVRRRALDMYASLLKARRTQAWRDVDTTALKVSFDFAEFRSWYDETAGWYRMLGDRLASRELRPIVLDFEEFTSWTELQLRTELCRRLHRLGVPVKEPNELHITLTRQDRTPVVFDCFDDPEAVRDILRKNAYLEGAVAPFELGLSGEFAE